MLRKTLSTFILTLCIFTAFSARLEIADASSAPSGVRLFNSKQLYVHGYNVYRYNGSEAAAKIEVDVPIWAQNFWSSVTLLKTTPLAVGAGFVKFESATGNYTRAEHDDLDAIYVVGYEFHDVQPFQEIKADVWFKLSISQLDMSRIQPNNVGNISDAKASLKDKYQTYVNETFYWDYSNSSVQNVINEINATLDGSKNIYKTVYATLNWFSLNMLYMDREDYPAFRLKASEILSKKSPEGKYFGVCRHFADAFIAIMRGFGIPTNLFYGLIFYDLGGNVGIIFGGGHAWCEVYMPPLGWIPIEVTISSRYSRDIIRVGLISDYYYLPIYKEYANITPKPANTTGDPSENLIDAYWWWSVGEIPPGTLDSIIHAITSIPVVNWIMLALIIGLAIDSYMLRKKLEKILRP
ncbi:MAG: transglutaminase domain-containing protein [Candidatus Bathyarchaeia archaeon]